MFANSYGAWRVKPRTTAKGDTNGGKETKPSCRRSISAAVIGLLLLAAGCTREVPQEAFDDPLAQPTIAFVEEIERGQNESVPDRDFPEAHHIVRISLLSGGL